MAGCMQECQASGKPPEKKKAARAQPSNLETSLECLRLGYEKKDPYISDLRQAFSLSSLKNCVME